VVVGSLWWVVAKLCSSLLSFLALVAALVTKEPLTQLSVSILYLQMCAKQRKAMKSIAAKIAM
jgi:hypothetical protein